MATMPTKIAATSSIPSMKRSMALRAGGSGAASGGSIAAWVSALAIVYADGVHVDAYADRGMPGDPHPIPPPCRVRRRRNARSVGRVVLCERRLELLHDRIRIAAGLADVVRPGLLQRLCGLAPFGKLVGGDRVDLVRAVGLELGDAGMLEVGPWPADLAGPLGRAVIVDHLLLARRHLVVLRL